MPESLLAVVLALILVFGTAVGVSRLRYATKAIRANAAPGNAVAQRERLTEREDAP